MKAEELIRSKDYWMTNIRLELYNILKSYADKGKKTNDDLATELGISKSEVTQILDCEFDGKLSTLVSVALRLGYAPKLLFWEFSEMDKIAFLSKHIPDFKP